MVRVRATSVLRQHLDEERSEGTGFAVRAGGAMQPGMSQGGLRKKPVQERSKITTQRILDTAARLLVEVGYQTIAASPTLLLQESGVSRGSFYSFFETPEKVLEELAFQCMQESAVQLDGMLQKGPSRHWHDVIDTLIEFYVACYERPLVRELWVGQNLTPPVRAADRAWMKDVAGQLLSALHSSSTSFDGLSIRQCLVAIEVLERLFQYAYTEDVEGSDLIVGEIRIVLIQYVSHYAQADKADPVRPSARRGRTTRRTDK
jgi:AcrR family transcriptional regulator